MSSTRSNTQWPLIGESMGSVTPLTRASCESKKGKLITTEARKYLQPDIDEADDVGPENQQLPSTQPNRFSSSYYRGKRNAPLFSLLLALLVMAIKAHLAYGETKCIVVTGQIICPILVNSDAMVTVYDDDKTGFGPIDALYQDDVFGIGHVNSTGHFHVEGCAHDTNFLWFPNEPDPYLVIRHACSYAKFFALDPIERKKDLPKIFSPQENNIGIEILYLLMEPVHHIHASPGLTSVNKFFTIIYSPYNAQPKFISYIMPTGQTVEGDRSVQSTFGFCISIFQCFILAVIYSKCHPRRKLLIFNSQLCAYLVTLIAVFACITSALPLRPSLHAPVLKVASLDGYIEDEATNGTAIRVAKDANSGAMQILLDDQDLVPGMPAAIYQYILTGHGADKFAIDERGTLFLIGIDVGNRPKYRLHVQAREVDTEPERSSEYITITIHVLYRNKPPKFAHTANATLPADATLPYTTTMTTPWITHGYTTPSPTSNNEESTVGLSTPPRTTMTTSSTTHVYTAPSSISNSEESTIGQESSRKTWEHVKTEVPENAPPGTIIHELGDSNTQGKIYFVIIDGNSDGSFAIDPDSGIIVVTQDAQLNRMRRPVYFLTIEARIKGSNKPIFPIIVEVSIEAPAYLINDQHRFVTELQDPQPGWEKVFAKLLSKFTGPCSLLMIERVEEKPDSQIVYWYAVNPENSKLCETSEYRMLFIDYSRLFVAGTMGPWLKLKKLENMDGHSSFSYSNFIAVMAVVLMWTLCVAIRGIRSSM